MGKFLRWATTLPIQQKMDYHFSLQYEIFLWIIIHYELKKSNGYVDVYFYAETGLQPVPKHFGLETRATKNRQGCNPSRNPIFWKNRISLIPSRAQK